MFSLSNLQSSSIAGCISICTLSSNRVCSSPGHVAASAPASASASNRSTAAHRILLLTTSVVSGDSARLSLCRRVRRCRGGVDWNASRGIVANDGIRGGGNGIPSASPGPCIHVDGQRRRGDRVVRVAARIQTWSFRVVTCNDFFSEINK